MHEDTLERLGLGQTDGAVSLRVAQCQQCRAQQRRTCKVRMVIGKGAELDHGAMLPQGFRLDQTQKIGGRKKASLARRLIIHHIFTATLQTLMWR